MATKKKYTKKKTETKSKKDSSDKKVLMGLREYARHQKMTLSNVQHHIEMGNISYEMDGGRKKIDPVKADKQLAENRRERIDSQKASEENAGNYTKLRAISTLYDVKIKRLAFETKAGNLVEVDKVKSQQFKIAKMIRDSLLTIPNKISDRLAAMDDSHEIHLLLTEHITESLQVLVDNEKRSYK